jgi:hypothetical protein
MTVAVPQGQGPPAQDFNPGYGGLTKAHPLPAPLSNKVEPRTIPPPGFLLYNVFGSVRTRAEGVALGVGFGRAA